MPVFSFSADPETRSPVFDRATYRILLCEAEVALWLSIFLLDAPSASKYLSVTIPFFLALPVCFPPRFPGVFVSVALGLTLVADLFFVLLSPPRPVVAISLFLVVQVVYCLFLHSQDRRVRPLSAFAVRVAVCLVVLPPIFFVFGADPIPLLGGAYGVWLVANLIGAMRGKDLRFACGMLLFFFCDLSLGVAFLLSRRGSAPLSSFFGCAAWAFYPPSQTLIALSAEGGHLSPARE